MSKLFFFLLLLIYKSYPGARQRKEEEDGERFILGQLLVGCCMLHVLLQLSALQ